MSIGNLSSRYEPVLPDIPYEVDEDDGLAVKIVRLVRNNEPLGATIKCQPDGYVQSTDACVLTKRSRCVRVARVMRGGVADRSGCIQVGDRVLEVNGVAVTGKQPPDIVQLLAECERTVSVCAHAPHSNTLVQVTFKLVPAGDDSLASVLSDQLLPSCSTNVRMRALFDYEPSRDPLHPCVEAGMTFRCVRVHARARYKVDVDVAIYSNSSTPLVMIHGGRCATRPCTAHVCRPPCRTA
jgi:hypothetical protein